MLSLGPQTINCPAGIIKARVGRLGPGPADREPPVDPSDKRIADAHRQPPAVVSIDNKISHCRIEAVASLAIK